VKLFKVPEGKRFEAPPILLHRAATLRGVVVDDGGKPLAGAGVSGVSMSTDRRTGQPQPREVTASANERGEFSIAGLDPRESLRLRVTAKETWKVVTIAKPGGEAVRIVVAATERFQVSGSVADAEGKPVADAVLEVWHRDWRPPPNQAEPKKLTFKEPIRADGQGRFTTPVLSPDGSYRFTVRAAGAKTAETAWLDATDPQAAKPQKLVVVRLGGVSGVVRDRAGTPIADVQVTLIAKDSRTETFSSGQGEFKLETPVGKPYCVIVRHPDFRADGAYHEKNPPELKYTMARLAEPGEKLAPRPMLAREERDKILKRLLEPFQQRLAKSTSTQEKVSMLQSLTGPAPDFVTEFLEKHPLSPMYNEMLLGQVAMKRVSHNPDEAEELIGRMKQGAQKSMAYGMLADALPEKARARKLEILAEALVGAKSEKSPEFRAIAMGQVAKHLWNLGEKDRATSLLREAEKIANGLSTSAFAGYARGVFATELALIDLPKALALMKDLKDPDELARHHGNTAHRIAGVDPAGAVKVLDKIPPPGENRFNQRDQYAIRVCYRMAKVDLPAALKLAASITDAPSRAYALGVIAQGAAKNDAKQATDLLRRAFALLEEDAARPDPPQLTSPLTQGSVAVALVLIAENVEPTLVRECLWRSVALHRPHTEDPQKIWLYATGNNGLAMAAARYDGKLAEFLLPSTKDWTARESSLAEFLANPQRAVEAAEKAPKGKSKGDLELVLLIGYLSTDQDRLPRLIFNSLGMWRIDVEDIEF
jgi:tetratricopeptide (TPR) repeat protein